MLYTLNRLVYSGEREPGDSKRKHKNGGSAEKKEKGI